MPTYDYRCRQCRRRFSTTMTLSRHARGPKPRCPRCGSRKVDQVPSRFLAVTSKKT